MKKDTLGNIISISRGKNNSISNIPCASSKLIIGIVDLRNDNNLVYTDDKHGTETTTKSMAEVNISITVNGKKMFASPGSETIACLTLGLQENP